MLVLMPLPRQEKGGAEWTIRHSGTGLTGSSAADEDNRGPMTAHSPRGGGWGWHNHQRKTTLRFRQLLGAGVPSSYYEIRVSGTLPPEALLDFERLSASVEPVETVVHGPIQDQAALNGLLARLEEFGVQVLEIRRLHGRDPRTSEDLG